MNNLNGQLIKDLRNYANKAVCVYTHERSKYMWNKIKNRISETDKYFIEKINEQIENPDNCPQPNGWGNSKDHEYDNACKQLCEYINQLCNKLSYADK